MVYCGGLVDLFKVCTNWSKPLQISINAVSFSDSIFVLNSNKNFPSPCLISKLDCDFNTRSDCFAFKGAVSRLGFVFFISSDIWYNYEYIFICEDDIKFLNPILFLEQLDLFLSTSRSWDVILVAGNNMIPYTPIDSTCIQVTNCQTTTGYIVKREYYNKLIDNFKEGIQKQIKEPSVPEYKIDKYWFKLQRDDNWFLIIPLSVIQREDYSDIEKKVTDFSNYMLNYKKAYKNK